MSERDRSADPRHHVLFGRSRTVRQRTENLHAHFGDIFATIECLDLGMKKAPFLARHPSGIWVEDNHENGIAGADLGHRTYMIRRSHNRSREKACRRRDLIWVDCWGGIMADGLTIPGREGGG